MYQSKAQVNSVMVKTKIMSYASQKDYAPLKGSTPKGINKSAASLYLFEAPLYYFLIEHQIIFLF